MERPRCLSLSGSMRGTGVGEEDGDHSAGRGAAGKRARAAVHADAEWLAEATGSRLLISFEPREERRLAG